MSNDAWRAIEANEILWSANEDVKLWKLIRKEPEFHTWNAVRASLREHLTLVVARLYDPYQPAREAREGQKKQQERGGNRASLPHLVHILGDKAVVAHLSRAADKLVAGARVDCVQLECEDPGKTLISVLRRYRNENLAHALFDMDECKEKLLFDHIDHLLGWTLPIVSDLALGLKDVRCDFDQVRGARKERARVFWAALREGMAVRHGAK